MQIAAIIDRSFPQDRDMLFWNIVITHLLSVGYIPESQTNRFTHQYTKYIQMSPQTSPDKRKLYGTLAQKQIERAAQVTEQVFSCFSSSSKSGPALT